jgi:rhodanese-related sulfurtransferase
MKTLLSILAFAVTFTAPLRAEDSKSEKSQKPAVKEVTVDEAEKLITNTPGLIVLDVRIPEEFDHEHIKGAVNVNFFDVDFDKLIADLDQTKPVLLHCASGRRSRGALTQMTGKVKFPQIYHMSEGFSAWKAAKKPFEGKPLPRESKNAPQK